MNQTKKLLLFFLSIGLFWSCSEDDSSVDSVTLPEEHKPIPSLSWDETVIKVAQDVAEKMNDEHFRKTLKHEVMLQFDGDYNILLSSMVNRMPIYNAYKENVQAMSSNSTENGYLSHLDFSVIEQAAKDYPQMQLAVQVNADLWNPETEKLSVVYDLLSYTDDIEFIGGFEPNGNQIMVDAINDPVENFVVVSRNERTYSQNGEIIVSYSDGTFTLDSFIDCIEGLEFNPIVEPPRLTIDPCLRPSPNPNPPAPVPDSIRYKYYRDWKGEGYGGQRPTLIETWPAQQIANSSPSSISVMDLSPVGNINGVSIFRPQYEYEKIHEIKVGDCPQLEKWRQGKLELKVSKYINAAGNPFEAAEILQVDYDKIKRSDICDEWYADKRSLHLWRFAETGTTIGVHIWEEDNQWFEGDEEFIEDIGALTNQILDNADIDTTVNTIFYQALALGASVDDNSESAGYLELSTFNNDDFFDFPGKGQVDVKIYPED